MKRYMPFSILIGMMTIFLSVFLVSCTGAHNRFLVIEAASVHAGQAASEVKSLLGPPDARHRKPDAREAWYYYVTHRHFWQKIPLIGPHLGKVRTEALEVIMQDNSVQRATYYELAQPAKQ